MTGALGSVGVPMRVRRTWRRHRMIDYLLPRRRDSGDSIFGPTAGQGAHGRSFSAPHGPPSPRQGREGGSGGSNGV